MAEEEIGWSNKSKVMTLAIFLVIVFVAFQVHNLSLEENISEAYTSYYFGLAVIGAVGVVGLAAFQVRYGDILGIHWPIKALSVIGWTVFIVMITSTGQQIYPVPVAYIEPLQIGPTEEMWTSAVIPPIVEDLAFLFVLPMVLTLFTLLILERVGYDDPGRKLITVVVVASCLVASTGYNIWFLPGFTSAHIPTYGGNQGAFVGAWVFSFGQSLVYMFTGWFVPFAHMIHNGIITNAQAHQVVGGT
jgi:hypothetical protein